MIIFEFVMIQTEMALPSVSVPCLRRVRAMEEVASAPFSDVSTAAKGDSAAATAANDGRGAGEGEGEGVEDDEWVTAGSANGPRGVRGDRERGGGEAAGGATETVEDFADVDDVAEEDEVR